jgi:hypothetical protein
MHTITKTIDGKPVSFWLEGEYVRASIGDRVIGDVAFVSQAPGPVYYLRGIDWQRFAATVLDYMPQTHPADSIIAADMKARLFDIVISVGEQLRKEAA